MLLVPARCTQCGASLTVDPSNEAAVCPYCSQAYIVEKAINYYNTTNVTNIDTLHADKVIVESSDSAENLFKAGETHIEDKHYTVAVAKFKEMSDKYPGDWRSWFGLLRALTNNFVSYKEVQNYSHNVQFEFYTKMMDRYEKCDGNWMLKFCSYLLDIYETFSCKISGEDLKPSIKYTVQSSVLQFVKDALVDYNKVIKEKYFPLQKHCDELMGELQSAKSSLSPRKAKNVQAVLNSDEVYGWSCYREKYIQEIVKLHEETKRAESERRGMWNRLNIDLFNKNVEKLQILQQKYLKEV